MARPLPAAFRLGELTISSDEVEVSGEITVSIDVTNTGDLAGEYQPVFQLNGESLDVAPAQVEPDETYTISFTIVPDTAGEYTLTIDEQTASFSVTVPQPPSTPPTTTAAEKAVPEPESEPEPARFVISSLSIEPDKALTSELIGIVCRATNEGETEGSCQLTLCVDGIEESSQDVTLAPQEGQTVTFYLARDEAGTYVVDVNGVTGEMVISAPQAGQPEFSEEVGAVEKEETSGMPVWSIIVIAAVALVMLAGGFFFWRRRTA